MTIKKIDCLVFSGGGAKGSYGAGVAKALFEYRQYKKIDTDLCYIGTSAGALNAAVLERFPDVLHTGPLVPTGDRGDEGCRLARERATTATERARSEREPL